MAHTLTQGLNDLSRELGEANVNQTTARINHYNDGLVDFFSKKKWPFAIKKNIAHLTTSNINTYTISDITNMRQPGGIKEITIGTSEPYLPIDWDKRFDSRYAGGAFFYMDPQQEEITFKKTIADTGSVITIYYYHIPARITDLDSVETWPLPDQYRKAVAINAASFVQYARYLGGEGDKKTNLFERRVNEAIEQQNERPSKAPKSFRHFLQNIGFRRVYPN